MDLKRLESAICNQVLLNRIYIQNPRLILIAKPGRDDLKNIYHLKKITISERNLQNKVHVCDSFAAFVQAFKSFC